LTNFKHKKLKKGVLIKLQDFIKSKFFVYLVKYVAIMLSVGISSSAGLSLRKTQFIRVVNIAYSFVVNNLESKAEETKINHSNFLSTTFIRFREL